MQSLKKFTVSKSVLAALGAAILFGGSTPLAKLLVSNVAPVLLAGLLYMGSGIGLMLIRLIRDKGFKSPKLSINQWPWLAGAIGCGGILAPILLMFGLTQISSANASLLLNLEAVLSAVIAWFVFKENTDKRIVIGMLLIVMGGVLLSIPHGQIHFKSFIASLSIIAACLCWAIDNNLTKKVSATDSFFIAGSKGLIAGVVNISLAYCLGSSFPGFAITGIALVCGFFGYGLSLLLFILALRGLGTSRTSAYFSVAPFIGAAISILLFKEAPSFFFWAALILMGIGVWLHLTERHEHEHSHERLLHEHMHTHDEHHQHSHDFPYTGKKPHSHLHNHEPLIHSHAHYPDTEHMHPHS